MWLEHADHIPSSDDKVKNAWSFNCVSSWHVFMNKDNFVHTNISTEHETAGYLARYKQYQTAKE
jgi:hypothetical protein